MNPRRLFVAASLAAVATTTFAQEPVVTTAPPPSSASGWTLTPSFGFGQTYDDNISLFGVRTAEDDNNDVIGTYSPGVAAHYSGKHTSFTGSYTGSFLSYHTHDALNQWDQNGHVLLSRQVSQRLTWTANATASRVPSTDLVDLGGIPYRRVGAKTADGRFEVHYRLNALDSLTSSLGFQAVRFDRPEIPGGFVQGGDAIDGSAGWRRSLSSRLAAGADYNVRRAVTVGEPIPFFIHSVQGAVDYQLSSTWDMSAAAGIVFLPGNALTPARTGPSWRFEAHRHRADLVLNFWYARFYGPSFAFGGVMIDQEVGFGLHAALFHSRYFYTDQSAMFRDDQPLTNPVEQLPLRQFRFNSAIGWTPQPWVRIEGFYSRMEGTTLRYGGQTYRNRIGFQIVTFKPMRIR